MIAKSSSSPHSTSASLILSSKHNLNDFSDPEAHESLWRVDKFPPTLPASRRGACHRYGLRAMIPTPDAKANGCQVLG